MPFSHHSHSGEYVRHAVNSLDEVVARVKEMNFHVYCLTEHCPRYRSDLLYPEESDMSVQDLSTVFDKYVEHAKRIQREVNSDESTRLTILVGFESEGGIDDDQLRHCQLLRTKYEMDLVLGSVHYIDAIPIDFDRESWLKAKSKYSSFRDYYKAYFDYQYEVIDKLQPEVVTHFDLIRLFEDSDNDICEITGKPLRDIDMASDWPEVWQAIIRNIKLITSQNHLIELNSAALRKKWDTPYPKRDITKLALENGAKFCLSDDSHGVKQVGLNYEKVLAYIQSFGPGFPRIYFYSLAGGKPFVDSITVEQLAADPFWS